MSEVMIVDPDILPKSPKAFREYVKEFFVEKQILGKTCLVAARTTFEREGRGKGVAPSHSLDLHRWKEGLGGEDLNGWIRRRAEAKDGIWLLYGVDPPPCGLDDD